MAQFGNIKPLPRVVKQGRNAPNEYLAYLTRPEMRHLRANPAAPHDERLPDKGPLNTLQVVPMFWGVGDGPGAGTGADGGGDSMGHDAMGGYASGLDAHESGYGMPVDPGPIGDPGDDPRASEGGGDWEHEPQPAAAGPTDPIVDPPSNGNGTDTPAADTGPTEAELLAERIADAMNAIKGLFGNRQGVYNRLRDASYDLSESGIADAYAKAGRRLNFQMLRQGLDTGQPDIDLRADLSKVKNDSLADAMRHAQGLSEALMQRDASKRSSLMSQALTGQLTPGAIGGMAGTLSAGVPQSWGGISDIGWNIPTGYASSGYGGFMPSWQSQDTGAYFGSTS